MSKISKKSKRRLIFLTMLFFCAVISLISAVFGDWSQIMANTKESKALREQYESLLKSEESLESEVAKLQDPEYIARYAREKYLYSKKGEFIIKLPE